MRQGYNLTNYHLPLPYEIITIQIELTTPDLSWSCSHFKVGGGCCPAIARQAQRQFPGLPQAKQLPMLGRRSFNIEDWTAWGCCWVLAVKVEGTDVRTSEGLLSAANEVLLFFNSWTKSIERVFQHWKYASRRQNFPPDRASCIPLR